MDFPRPCGCKGCRTCLICEKEYGIEEKSFLSEYEVSIFTLCELCVLLSLLTLHLQKLTSYVFCYKCNRIFLGKDVDSVIGSHPSHDQTEGIEFSGVYVHPEFISRSEEDELMAGIDSMRWDISQSGRRKQVIKCIRKIQYIFYSRHFGSRHRIMDQKRISKK